MAGSRVWLPLAGAALLILALGLPWAGTRFIETGGSGTSCIADLSGTGGLICDYIGTAGHAERVSGAVGAQSPARLFLVLAVGLVCWGQWAHRSTPVLVAAVLPLAAVAITLPEVVSGQVTALLATVLLLAGVGGRQRVRSFRSATWGETEGSKPNPSAR